MKDYQVLVELDKNDADAHLHLALIFARMNRWSDAEFHFGKAMQLKPKAPWILQPFGAAKLRAKKIAEGEALLLESEEINPNHSPTLAELARLREIQHESAAAEEYYRRAIEADPNNSYALYHFARFLFHEGETTQAYEIARAALAANPTNAGNKALIQELKAKIGDDAAAAKKPKQILVQIRCSAKSAGKDGHRGVVSIGGVNSDGKRWKTAAPEAIALMEMGKYAFFIEKSGRRVDVVIAKAASGQKFLRSSDDTKHPEDLLALPDCP